MTFKRIFKCKEIEELTEKITNDMLNMYMCIFYVYFQPEKPLQDGEFFVIMYANVMRNSVQELSLTMIISFATKYPMI